MEDKKYNLKNDIIFKAFFSRKGNEEFLKDFLNALLGIEIETIKIKEEVNLEQLSAMEKGGRLDLQATLNERQIVNIELQSKDRGNFRVRTVFYASKIISREVVKGTDYDDLEKTILINILGYEMFPQYEDYISKTSIVLEKHKECEAIDNIQWWFIELPKFRKAHPDMNIKINQWLAFIDDEDKELVEVAEKKNKVLKKARNEVEYLTGNAAVRRMAELREKWDLEYAVSMDYAKKQGLEDGKKQGIKEGKEQGIKEGKEQGIKEGKEQGIKEGKEQGIIEGKEQGIIEGKEQGIKEGIEEGIQIGERNNQIKTVKEMINQGLSIDLIEKITHLSTEEINNIKKRI